MVQPGMEAAKQIEERPTVLILYLLILLWCAQDKEDGKFDINRKTLGTSRDPDGNPWCGEKKLQIIRCASLT
ncbi:hypothetical protein HYFRA_00010587 [Hymenoscyphus fraxineus]|uniref:Uncharacterized protein n=1 Tax=Hymenoscyphus fraxineus TaxID=746836 RepID=A0A9N9PMW5_9HELO|nr:hypothetical protein HYFRA_00010587 [Hymenoscyphus fraxineus]